MSLSKRDDSETSGKPITINASAHNSLTLKQSQITKTLQGKELLELYETVDYQRKIINDCKRVLGDVKMTDASIIKRIVALQAARERL